MELENRRVPSVFIIPLSLIFVGLLLFVALLNSQRELAIASLMLFGVVAGTRLWTRWSLAGVECRADVDKHRAFPGEKLVLKAFAENRKFLPVWLQVRLRVGGLAHAASGETMVVDEASLLWYQGVRFSWELTAQRRGVHDIGPLQIVSGDLLGFFPKAREAADKMEVIVYPRLVPLKPFSLPRREFFGVPGAESPVHDPVYILGTRDYQHGRPAKHIHWKATARHHKLQEKVFEPSAQEKVLLVLDVREYAEQKAEDEFESALEIIASMAASLDGRNCAVGLVTNGVVAGGGSSVVPVARNPEQLTTLLETLARLQMEPSADLVDMMRNRLALPWGLSCLCFTLEEGGEGRVVEGYFRDRRTPCTCFVNRPGSRSGGNGFAGGSLMRGLDEVRITEGRR